VSLIFISYAREDEAVVRTLARGLEHAGHEVWWDKELSAGEAFRNSIQDQLEKSDVVVVLWSERAKVSRYVVDEAESGARRGILLPLRIDTALPPLGFGGFHMLDFANWGGNFASEIWRQLLAEIERISAISGERDKRPPISILRNASISAVVWGAIFGSTIWAFYVTGSDVAPSNLLGSSIIDAFVMALGLSVPIAWLSALEMRRAGFGSFTLVFGRSCLWLARGAAIAVAVVVVALISGIVRDSAQRNATAEVVRVFVVATLASASAITAAKLIWSGARLALRVRER
jgi:hypothetical protein